MVIAPARRADDPQLTHEIVICLTAVALPPAESVIVRVTVNVLVPGGPANTNLVAQDAPFDRAALIQPDVMQAPVVWLASEASTSMHGQRVIAYYWDESLGLEERLAKAAAPLAWQQLGRQAIYPGRQ